MKFSLTETSMVPDLDDPAWITVTAPILAKLTIPRTVSWIRQWVRENETISCDYLNLLAYLSIKGLATSCYDKQRRTHWVVVGNVPYGWLTENVGGDAIVRTKKKVDVTVDSDDVEEDLLKVESKS